MHEHAGDVAGDHHFHDGAVQHYQDALAVRDISEADRSRLSEKLAHSLFRGGNPDAAMPWLERALPQHFDNPEKAEIAVKILLQAWRQLWVDSKTEDAFPVLERAIQIANAAGEPRLQKLAKLRMLTQLRMLCRYEDAERALLSIDGITTGDAPALRSAYFTEKAILAAVRGEAAQAYGDFEQAIQAAKDSEDSYYLTVVWSQYASWAVKLGNIELGKTCQERALLVARHNQITWRIAYLCLGYADYLTKLGKQDIAYGFLLEALSYDVHAAVMDDMFAEVGIPLALYMKDEATLLKCAHTSTLARSFKPDMPADVGGVAAIAGMLAIQGQNRKAQLLLHRAIEKTPTIRGVWHLPLEVARHGKRADIQRARQLLEIHVLLPCSGVTNACLTLFDALVAKRNGNITLMRAEAATAIELFERLHWYAYADVARALLPAAARPSRALIHHRPFLNIKPALTEREQQVAELVLKGLTNRAIAENLSIRERTVETHMTSIMSHLGIRSRYQLVGALSETEP